MLEPLQLVQGQASVFHSVPPVVAPISAITTPVVTVKTVASPAYEAADSSAASTVSTTLAGLAVAGAVELSLNSAAGVATPRFLIAGDNADDARPELVEVVGLNGTTVKLAEPIQREIDNAGPVHGYSVAVGLSVAQAAQKGRFDVRLEATIGGVKQHWFETGFIVAWPIHPPVTAATLGQHIPDVHRLRYAEDRDGQEVIKASWWDTVVPALDEQRIDYWTLRDVRKLAPVHAAAAYWHLVMHDERLDEDVAERAEKMFERRLEAALNAASTWVDTDA